MLRILGSAALLQFASVFLFLPCVNSAQAQTISGESPNSIPITSSPSISLSRPQREFGTATSVYIIVNEPLFRLDGMDDRVTAWIVENYSSNSEGLNWEFKLRHGIEWSDAQVFDTDDISFTFDLILNDERFRSPNSLSLRGQVEGVSVQDDLTFSVTLKKPNVRFVHELLAARRDGTLHIFPEHVWEGNVNNWADTLFTLGDFSLLIGSGPYVKDTAEFDFIRNVDWWGAATGILNLPEPEQLIWHDSSSVEDDIEKLVNNELDVGPELSYEQWLDVKERNPNIIAWRESNPVSWPGPCGRQLDFNTHDDTWKDPNLRKAVAAFINRQQIIDEAYSGSTSLSATMFPDYGALAPITKAIVDEGLGTSADPDPDSGIALLIAAGYEKNAHGVFEKDGQPLELAIHVNSESTEYTRTVDLIVEQLKVAGIDASAIEVDNGTFWARVLPRGEFQIVHGWLSCGSVVDPYASLKRYHAKYAVPVGHRSPGFKNVARWDSYAAKAFSEQVDKIEMLAPGDPKIVDLTVEAYRHIVADTPFIPLVQEARIIPFNTTNWKGWPTAENPYASPMIQWGQLHAILQNLEKAN